MEVSTINSFIHGGVMALSVTAGLFFFKFWTKTEDRFFAYFAMAFALFAVERILLILIDPKNEVQPFVYSFRMLAFLIIAWAVIDKNRNQARH